MLLELDLSEPWSSSAVNGRVPVLLHRALSAWVVCCNFGVFVCFGHLSSEWDPNTLCPREEVKRFDNSQMCHRWPHLNFFTTNSVGIKQLCEPFIALLLSYESFWTLGRQIEILEDFCVNILFSFHTIFMPLILVASYAGFSLLVWF